MRIWIVWILLISLLSGGRLGWAHDPPSWSLAPWTQPRQVFGRTVAELQAAYGTISPIQTSDTVVAYPWVAERLTGTVWYAVAQDRVWQITFTPRYGDVPPTAVWTRVADLMIALTQLYGPPSVQTNYGARWDLPDVIVVHRFQFEADQGVSHVVQYTTKDPALLPVVPEPSKEDTPDG